MFKNEMVKMILDLQKHGVGVFLTEDGVREFLKLIRDDEMAKIVENVG